MRNLKIVNRDNLNYMFKLLSDKTKLEYYYLSIGTILANGGNFIELYWNTYKEYKQLLDNIK